jgi:hypothetical protein
MSPTMSYTETLIVTHCWCGIAVAIPSNLHEWMCHSNQNHAFCPRGHKFVFNDTLEKELATARAALADANQRVRATRDLLEHEERSHAATKGHLTRTRKRVHHGTCSHCNRHFKDLERHMASKHADQVAHSGT